VVTTRPAPELPRGVLAVLRGERIDPESLRPVPGRGPRRPIRRLVGCGVVVELAAGADTGADIGADTGADTAAGRLRLRRELWGRCWAAGAGLPTPPVLGADADGGWLVSAWLPAGAPTGPDFLDAAVATAGRIAAAPPPPAGPPRSVWRSPRRAAPLRLARGFLGGVPTRLWWRARQAAAALPRVPVAHGDFYHRNVLWRPDSGTLHTVDWEYLGTGLRHGDLLRLWSVLPGPLDRAGLLARLLDGLPAAQRADVGTLALYLALRLLGENVKGDRRDRDEDDLVHARALLPEAYALAEDLGGWPSRG
jgi:aminoglycoside phosphotransferase